MVRNQIPETNVLLAMEHGSACDIFRSQEATARLEREGSLQEFGITQTAMVHCQPLTQ